MSLNSPVDGCTSHNDIFYFYGFIDLGVYGLSKGGDISLAIAAFLPQVKSIVWANGSAACYIGDTTYRNSVFPSIGFHPERVLDLADGTRSLINCTGKVEEQSVYPYEKSKTNMLFIVGTDDLFVCSNEHADLIKKRLDSVNKSNYEIALYEGLGHLLNAPFTPPMTTSPSPFVKGMINYGGNDIIKHSSQ